MIAAVLHGIGEPIQIEERTSLHASPGHQVVRLKYAAINHRDLWIQQGKYAGLRFPIVLGSDGMGQVDQRDVLIQPGLDWGTHQTHQERSYRILGLPDDGTFATEVVVPQGNVFSVPGHLSPAEAAALPLAGLTAYRAVMVKAEVSSGEKVLVTGIGGGVATLAMQMALAQGAEVYVTSGSVETIAIIVINIYFKGCASRSGYRTISDTAISSICISSWVAKSICNKTSTSVAWRSVG